MTIGLTESSILGSPEYDISGGYKNKVFQEQSRNPRLYGLGRKCCMLAIISDIHSNIEALQMVLDDIHHRGIKTIHCLGDLIGYGPDPGPCLDTVMDNCDEVIMGNHDFATLYEPARFNFSAESAAYWTRKKLDSETDLTRMTKRWEYLGQRGVSVRIPGEDFGVTDVFLVHGSPRRPINEYIFPDDISNNSGKISASMDRFVQLCFVGHTHVPGVFYRKGRFFHSQRTG